MKLAKLPSGFSRGCFFFYGYGRAGIDSSDKPLEEDGGWIRLPFVFGEGALLANVTIGNPPQVVAFALDTGSADIWVESAANPFCEELEAAGAARTCAGKTFNSSTSSTFNSIPNEFYIQYFDKTYGQGLYATDTFGIGGATLSNQTFAVASKGNLTHGVIGLGYEFTESSTTTYEYSGILRSLREQRYIGAMVYSLYTNDLFTEGNILFGGIDRAKYDGDLVPLPMVPDIDGYYTHVGIELQSLQLEFPDKKTHTFNSSINLPFLADSGTTLLQFPTDIFMSIVDYFGAEYNSTIGFYTFTGCSKYVPFESDQYSNYSMVFGFDGITIKVTLDYLVNFVSADDHDLCQIIISYTDDPSYYILGDTFLNSAYVVYDFGYNRVFLAQANFDVENEDIVAVRKGLGKNAIADAIAS
ncbi:aspartic peptidase domain-containing protein [Myxozyma melibiosi]|uniref:Aspartic peptidase domain-containing protein n=1 Tax=Myxozyma melibiosi TaxID=54550 RepID=A0ABR1F672_9ASCO